LLLGFAFGSCGGVGVYGSGGHVADGASDSTADQKLTSGSKAKIANDDVLTPLAK
jgi:hypothetical protein